MPTSTVYIAGVVPQQVRRGLTRYQVFARRTLGEIWSVQYSTLSMFVASLCERARELGTPATIKYRDTQYGPEIVTVELEGVAS